MIFRKEQSVLDEPIRRILEDMAMFGPTSEEHPKLVAELDKLLVLKAKLSREPISSNTLVMVGGNILVALVIVAYERNHVMVSKAKDYILKPR